MDTRCTECGAQEPYWCASEADPGLGELAAEIKRLRAALENARRDILYIAPQRGGQRHHMAEAAAERIASALHVQQSQTTTGVADTNRSKPA